MKIYKDKKSIYVIHGDRKVRPLALTNEKYMKAFSGRPLDEMKLTSPIIRTKNDSKFKEGDVVTKYHYGSTVSVRIKNEKFDEVWMIHETTKSASKGDQS